MKKLLSDIANQLWTLLGMFVAWVVLEGSAKTVVGYAIVACLVIWTVTLNLRNLKDDE
jgi:ABC-type uncharacterized transport system fused permease/ATPase subunit